MIEAGCSFKEGSQGRTCGKTAVQKLPSPPNREERHFWTYLGLDFSS
jgi:hypothetical protein